MRESERRRERERESEGKRERMLTSCSFEGALAVFVEMEKKLVGGLSYVILDFFTVV